jgi:hypothetical protein
LGWNPFISGRHLRAPLAELPDRNAELPRPVGEIAMDASAGEHHDADRQDLQHRVLVLERRGIGVLCPVGLERDLRHLAIGRPFGGDQFGALRGSAMQQPCRDAWRGPCRACPRSGDDR